MTRHRTKHKIMKSLNSILIGAKEYLPLIEGGKGVAISTGQTTGAWAAAGGIGTFSAVNADSYDENGESLPVVYHGKTRRERHDELIKMAIQGGIEQAKIAYETAKGKGRIHMNVLWEMGACEKILHGIMDKVQDLVEGVTCGAGMPYKVGEICAKYKSHYLPIVSSARAFRALWKRSYHKVPDWLGGVVYEDPWLAGGHNGLSNSESPTEPQSPYERVRQLRSLMRDLGLGMVPIIMAGGVWCLSEWQDWIDNPELGPIAFQFGTRPLVTQESPISLDWKKRLLTLKEGDILLNKFSPTGFYSSAVLNPFLQDLVDRSERQVTYSTKSTDVLNTEYLIGVRQRSIYMTKADRAKVSEWEAVGFSEPMRTPDGTLVFVTPDQAKQIHQDQVDCMGCLSSCGFSNWSQVASGTTGRKADPRSFCIQKSLQDISHGGSLDHNLMFAGHHAYRFATDPFYEDGYIPTVKELVERIQTGY